VKEHSSREVILPASIRNRLTDIFEGENVDINLQRVFAEAKDYVYITLRDDDLIRYVNSDVHNKAYYETPRGI
jgi:hypothetical protein